jgi:hypothetical protein
MRIYFFIVSFLFGAAVRADNTNTFPEQDFTAKIFVDIPGYELNFKTITSTIPKEVRWRPNTRANLGVGVSLKGWFGVSVAAKSAMTQEDRFNKGETEYQDWRFFLNYTRIQLFLNYQEYRGFFIDNSGEIDQSYVGSPSKIQEPSMTARNYSANMSYVMSPDRFSIQAAMDQTSRQEKSGGSWLVGAAINVTVFNNDNSLIPTSVRGYYGVDQNIKTGTFTNLTVKGGYGYNFIIAQKYWVGGVLAIGAGSQKSRYSDGTTEKFSTNISGKGDLNITGGYNGDQFFTGFSLLADTNTYKTESLEISTNLYVLSLFAGTRF